MTSTSLLNSTPLLDLNLVSAPPRKPAAAAPARLTINPLTIVVIAGVLAFNLALLITVSDGGMDLLMAGLRSIGAIALRRKANPQLPRVILTIMTASKCIAIALLVLFGAVILLVVFALALVGL